MLLKLENISKNFGGLKAVNNVSFSIEEGTLTAIIGPNGAGKTTLFNIIAGAFPASSGSMEFDSKPHPIIAHKCAKAGIARTFQNVRLFKDMTLLENILCSWNSGQLYRTAFLPKSYMENERIRLKRAYYLLEDLSLEDSAYITAGDLPFGKQRIAEIARALALNPKLLLLDEPAAGLNRSESANLAKIIKHIISKGITVLLVEHDMELVMNLVERMIVLESGELIADGTPKEIRNNPKVIEAYLGSAVC